MRTAIYTRISSDRDGDRQSVQNHATDCRTLCDRKGWDVVGIYEDNDTRSDGKKRRPEYERMIADVKAGDLDAIVGWHVDRITRHPREIEDIIDLCDKYPVQVATYSGNVDTTTTDGRLTLRILGDVARAEVERIRERVTDQKRHSARAGKVSGGGYRAFGYQRDGKTVDADEAEVVRDMAKRLLAGESLNSVARGLAEQGVVTTADNAWTPQSVKQTMTGVRLSGRREHLGEFVGKADWPAIISVEDSDRLRMMLLHRPAPKPLDGAPRTYLLSGLLVCGRCDHALVGKRKGVTPRYVCRRIPGTNRCGGTVTNAERTDEHVRDLVVGALATPKLREARQARRHADPTLFAAVEQDRQQLDELADMWANRELSRAEWQRARATVQARLTANERQLARATLPDPLDDFLGSYDQMQARWKQRTNLLRRVILDAVVEQVVVGAAKPKKGAKAHWDPERFAIRWRA